MCIQSKPSVPHLLAAVLKFRYHFSCCAHSSLGYLIATLRATTAPFPATAPLSLVRSTQERLEVRFLPGPSVSLARRGAVWRTLAMLLYWASRFPLRAAGGVFWNLPECIWKPFPDSPRRNSPSLAWTLRQQPALGFAGLGGL